MEDLYKMCVALTPSSLIWTTVAHSHNLFRAYPMSYLDEFLAAKMKRAILTCEDFEIESNLPLKLASEGDSTVHGLLC